MEPAPVREELLRRGFSPAVADELVVRWKWRILDAEKPEDFIGRYLPHPLLPRNTDTGLSLRFRSEQDRQKFMRFVRDNGLIEQDWPWRQGEQFEEATSFVVEFRREQ